MQKKQMVWKTKGMNQDLSVSAFNPEFAFENMNLRLSTNNGNTQLSWVNEKGTAEAGLDKIDMDPSKSPLAPDDNGYTLRYKDYLYGHPVGTAVMGSKLIVFTTHTEGIEFTTGVAIHDFIYQLELSSDNNLRGKLLYKGNLGFSDEHPLETLVNYESEDIQKIYWTDGINQPRVINIEGNIKAENDTQFDFLPAVGSGAISVSRSNSNSGIFSPGVIQYCFTYYNKHGQQSNVVDTSSLHYISYSDRGASPEGKVSCSFTVTITNPDTNFDYIRLYSIQRTSLDAVPVVKIVSDIKTGVGSLSYTDNGTTGAIIDPTELLYIGGRDIRALTMTDKDGTLFLGNISMPHVNIESLQNIIRSQSISISFCNGGDEVNHVIKQLALGSPSGVYYHKQQLDRSLEEITTFKGGDTYRFGFQLQKNTGEWSEPIWLNDVRNAKYPQFDVTNHIIKLVYAKAILNFSDYDFDFGAYKKIRPVIVYPNIADREVLCQGVLNPTVFNVQDRIDNSPFAQASWYFRPYTGAPLVKPGKYLKTRSDTAESLLMKCIEDVITTTCNSIANAEFSLGNFAGKTTAVYVLVATVTDNNIKKIRSNGCLYADYREPSNTSTTRAVASKDNNSGKTKRYPYLGIIPLIDTPPLDTPPTLVDTYAFISSSPWPSEYGSITDYTEGGALKYRDISDISTTPTPFNMYKDMSLLPDSEFKHTYYLNDGRLVNSTYDPNAEEGPTNKKYEDFVFKFYDTRKFYQVTFVNLAGEIAALTPTPVEPSSSTDISSSYKGTAIPFKHYESLLCASELGDNNSAAKQVEIQGSYKLYDTPFTAAEDFNKPAGDGTQSVGWFTFSVSNDTLPSNTQFFIDQSIVTLNSPDIEFDTDVQTYGTEGFGLRVIGVVPLTANVSAHHITTSSNMLENAHNMSEAYKEWSDGRADKMLEAEAIANYLDDRGHVFGSGELPVNTYLPHIAGKMGTGRHLVSDYLWNDVVVASSNRSEDKTVSSLLLHDFLIHPWHRTGSLNNDYRSNDKASSLLRTKKESNLLWSPSSFYVKDGFPPTVFSSVNFQIHLSENAEVLNYRLPAQKSGLSEINYYPNIDKVLYNKNGYLPIIKDGMDADLAISEVTSPISMKYKSGSHAVVALNGSSVPILPYVSVTVGSENVDIGKLESGELSGTTFWNASNLSFSQNSFNSPATPKYQHNDFLLLGELYKIRASNADLFGGNSPSAIRANNWQVGGNAVNLVTTGDVTLRWTIGDTYYQRYDCLKTYAFTPEDTNQLVEVLSFMCETHVNLDGRYDKNRGQIDNTMMKPEIFNLLNPVYSQQDNFFSYKRVGDEDATSESLSYPNQVTYSMTKNSGADVDEWTHTTMASNLELDGDKGSITKLTRLNDHIIAFQEKGISRILYNENAAISTTAGVPIELGNSGKVQGKQYISNTIGCSNKWSICNTPNGIYFMDSNEKSIYLFNGQLENLSIKGGMNSWSKKNIGAGLVWNPVNFGVSDGKSGFVSYYDRENQDVLFVNKDTTLAWSEKFGTFTSFYDYGGGSYFNSLQDIGMWAVPGEYTVENQGIVTTVCGDSTLFYLHNKGNYGVFFGSRKPYWMTLVGNPEPLRDKTFTNLEFRACIEGEGQTLNTGNYALHPTYKHFLPFNELECWDEYQHGMAELKDRDGHDVFKHHVEDQDKSVHLNRKFRIWRCDVPRDNVVIPTVPILPETPTDAQQATYDAAMATYNTFMAEEAAKGIFRNKTRIMDRLRNPWVYLKLTKHYYGDEGSSLPKAEIHDVMMSYFV